MPSQPEPTHIRLRAYNVGFGDCFLLSFTYPAYVRHVLIDFGSTKNPPGAPASYMNYVATRIQADCGGKLHAVVVTHRHSDHIRGFETNDAGTKSGDTIRACDPDVVVLPWTEDENAAENATDATTRTRTRAFRASLDAMSEVSQAVLHGLRDLAGDLPPDRFRHLAFVGEDNIKNLNAVRSLQRLGKKRVFVKYGVSARLTYVLPGVRVRVLGPPSLDQTGAIRDQRDEDAEEFWQLQARATRSAVNAARANERLFPDAPAAGDDGDDGGDDAAGDPIDTRWFRRRVREVRADSLYEIVTQLDEQMNNTSVILLFETRGKKLLFSGDAQYENWMYALGKSSVRSDLQDVDLYKVGHHGSRNATPRTLWGLFDKRAPAGVADRLITVNSTLSGFHGHTNNNSEVPRTTLVDALEANTAYTTTEGHSPTAAAQTIDIPLP